MQTTLAAILGGLVLSAPAQGAWGPALVGLVLTIFFFALNWRMIEFCRRATMDGDFVRFYFDLVFHALFLTIFGYHFIIAYASARLAQEVLWP